MADYLADQATIDFLEKRWSELTTFGQSEIGQAMVEFSERIPSLWVVRSVTIARYQEDIARLTREHSSELGRLEEEIYYLKKKLESTKSVENN